MLECIWEKFEDLNSANGVEILKESAVNKIKVNNDNEIEVKFENKNGDITSVLSKNVFFSNPLLEFIKIYENKIPQKVIDSANSLNYRNHISVHLTIDKKLFDDYINLHSFYQIFQWLELQILK